MDDQNDRKKPEKFKPSRNMIFYAKYRAKMGDQATDTEIAAEMGVSQSRFSEFRAKEGFQEWFEDKVAEYRTPIMERLEAIAWENIDDKDMWKELAKKYGFIDQESKIADKIKRLVVDLSGDESDEAGA